METDKLVRLINGVRSISTSLEITITASNENPTHVAIRIGVLGAVLFNTDFGLPDTVIDLAIVKLASISQKTLAAVK